MVCKVLVEIPKGTINNKYEFDHKAGKMVLDFVFENLTWPFNYGEVVGTLGGDGDALDAIVLSTVPIEQSTVANCIPFGVIKMLDRGEVDDKLLMAPVDDALAKKYKDIVDFSDEEKENIRQLYAEIARQKNKTITIISFDDKETAINEIKNSLV